MQNIIKYKINKLSIITKVYIIIQLMSKIAQKIIEWEIRAGLMKGFLKII